ncbi:neck protein [Vibrio phage vB_VcorM_GR28A]|nr:neck protein [Vibrio phage vB_VcorM_GR28A]
MLSPHFNHSHHAGQRKLIEDLITEAIQQRGVLASYLPRTVHKDNQFMNTAELVSFDVAADVEMYIESISNFNGDGSIFAKFGSISFEDTVTLMVVQNRFKVEVQPHASMPESEDLIYLSQYDMLFKVDKVLEDEDFRQSGINVVWRLKCSKYKFSGEDFNTDNDGLEDMIDELDSELDNILESSLIESKDQFLSDDESVNVEEDHDSRHNPDVDVDLGDIL